MVDAFSEERVEKYHSTTLEELKKFEQSIDRGFFDHATSILDVGCGDGKNTAHLAKCYPNTHIVGCDISPKMIEFASEKYPQEEYPNLRFEIKNGCKLEFEKKFSRIISFNCLHWIKDQEQAIRNMFQILEDGGKALLVVCPRSSDDDLQVVCRKLVLTLKWFFHFVNFKSEHSFLTEDAYKEILKKVGFRIDKIHQKNKEVLFQSREAFENFLQSILTPMYHLPEKKRAPFLNDLIRVFTQRKGIDSNGPMDLQVAQIEMHLSKELA